MNISGSKLLQLAAAFAADDDATYGAIGDVTVEHRLHRPCLNHNETVLAARWVGRGLKLNHNETVLSAPAPRGLAFNHNETVLAARPTGRGIGLSHNETVLAARSIGRGLNIVNHNETVLTAGQARNS